MASRNLNKESSLKLSHLKEVLHYCPDSGLFTRLKSSGGKSSGSIAGTIHHTGYVNISVNGRLYLAHRLAIFYVTGEWPEITDHKNRIRHDNRWCNLRLSNASENSCNKSMMRNNTSGHRGVSWNKREKRWHAQVTKDGRVHGLGNHVRKGDAVMAVRDFMRSVHGEFIGEISHD